MSGGTKVSSLPENTTITGDFDLLAVTPTGQSCKISLGEALSDTGATGVSTDADNALEVGTDGRAYLDGALLGGGAGLVTSVNAQTGAVVITAAGLGAVASINSETPVAGEITLSAADVGAADAAHTHAEYAPLAGSTFTGPLAFSGDTNSGLQVNSLTTTQRNALTPAAGMVIYNSTTAQIEGYDGSDWLNLGSILSGGSGDIDIASAANHWANTSGFYAATAQSHGEAEVLQAGSIVAGNLPIDGGTFWNASATASDGNVDFNTVTGLTAKPRRYYITAAGSARTVTASGFDVTSNIDTGAVIADGDTGIFEMFRIGSSDCITYLGSQDYLLTGGVSDASDTAKGIVELAIVSEVNTGTDDTRAATPAALAGSYAGTKTIEIEVFGPTEDVTTGDLKTRFYAPADMNGMNLVRVAAFVDTAGTTGTTDVQIRNVTDAVDVLSTKITIDSGETSTATAATPAVINTSNDDIATNDKWAIDVDATSTTKAKGLTVVMEFRLP